MITKKRLVPKNLKPKGPYSPGISVKDAVHISGQRGINFETGELVSLDFKMQCIQAFENIESILEMAELNLESVVQLSVFLKNMDDIKQLNQLIALYFAPPYPTKSVMVVAGLEDDALVMVDCIAYDTREYDLNQKILQDDCGGVKCHE